MNEDPISTYLDLDVLISMFTYTGDIDLMGLKSKADKYSGSKISVTTQQQV
jgi:hypothetical protein